MVARVDANSVATEMTQKAALPKALRRAGRPPPTSNRLFLFRARHVGRKAQHHRVDQRGGKKVIRRNATHMNNGKAITGLRRSSPPR